MDTPLVKIEFYGGEPQGRAGRTWELTKPPSATRLWYHVPQVGDRVDLIDHGEPLVTVDVAGADRPVTVREGTDDRRVGGKVFEVIWYDEGVKVLLTW